MILTPNELTGVQIQEINNKCPYNQGIFKEPFGIPVKIKELVIYSRYDIGGRKGGSYRGDDPEDYVALPPKDKMRVLDLVLKELIPNITYLQYKECEELIKDNTDITLEYYGNSTEWKIEYIILSELYALLETFNKHEAIHD